MSGEGPYPKRSEYGKGRLIETECPANPMLLLIEWLHYASVNGSNDLPGVLSTVGENGRPSSRVVLIKEYNEKGLFFFSNYQSRKGRDLENSPLAALNFFWEETERQVRLEGLVEKMSAAESDKYFSSRPLESQISAIISPQSEPIPNSIYLESKHAELLRISDSGIEEVVRPDYWGGYVFLPDLIEFWQGRPGRLNDRIEYRLETGDWTMVRLGP